MPAIISCFIGYSEGRLRANDDTFTSGGQCEDGLKMIIAIGDVEVPTVGVNGLGGNSHSPDPMSPNDQGCELLIITPPYMYYVRVL